MGVKVNYYKKYFSVTKPPVMVMTGKVQGSRIHRTQAVTKDCQPFQQILEMGTKVLGKSLTLNLLHA